VRQISEITRIYRGFIRRVNNGKPLDSFPFLSGDSYFYSCEYYFDSGNLLKVPSKSGRIQKNLSVFVKVSKIDEFCLFLTLNSKVDFRGHVLVLHNGDESINMESLEILNSRFRKVFAVNLLHENQSSIRIQFVIWGFKGNEGPNDKESLRLLICNNYKKYLSKSYANCAFRDIILIRLKCFRKE